MNPFTIIDDILADYASDRTRLLIHRLILLVMIAVTIWQASDGDWKVALGTALAALYAGANGANTPPSFTAKEREHMFGDSERGEEPDPDLIESGGPTTTSGDDLVFPLLDAQDDPEDTPEEPPVSGNPLQDSLLEEYQGKHEAPVVDYNPGEQTR